MKLAELPVHRVKRIMTDEEATNIVGTVVPYLEPNCKEAGIWIDDETEEPILAYLPMEEEVSYLRRSVLNIKYGVTKRQSLGIENSSRTFGMAPRKVYQRRESCRPTTLAQDQPDEHAVLVAFAEKFGKMFKEFAPHLFERDAEVLNEAGFNFATWSAMPVIRRDMDGGLLHFPEYDMTCACRDGWVLFFPGYKYVHGVTPMKPRSKDGYRYSIVYYALRGMKDCFTFAVETAKGAENRTKREEHMAAVLKGEESSGVF